MVQRCLGGTRGSAPSMTLKSVEAKTVTFSLVQLGGFVLSLCPDTVWDHSSVTNQCFVIDEAKMQNYCAIIGQDHSGAVL